MTITILHHLDRRIRDALDGARAAAAAIAKSAHEIIEVAQPEATPTAVGTAARADLLDREGVRALLSITHLSRVDGMLSAFGTVLQMIDDARHEERAVMIMRIEAEALQDVASYRTALAEGETDTPEVWAAGAFDALKESDPELLVDFLSVLPVDEARACYVAAFLALVSK